MSTLYTAEEINDLRLEAIASHLHGPYIFFYAKASDLTKICNGVGSDSMPSWAVKALTLIYESYSASAAIHDCRYYNSDGSDDNRKDSDEEFYTNCKLQWAKKWGRLRWIKRDAWRDFLKIRIAYRAVQAFGGKAWQEAEEKRKERGEL